MKNQTTVERTSDRELVVTRTFNGPARIVFKAWTTPELFKQWWLPASFGISPISYEADFRTGGTYRLAGGYFHLASRTGSLGSGRDGVEAWNVSAGATYGGFGLPYEAPMVDQMIENDGGSGEVKNVILNTGAYEAVYQGQVDTSLAFRTWELIEAAERGIELNEFPVSEYGVPDFYNVMIACNGDWLKENPEVAKAFIQAVVKKAE